MTSSLPPIRDRANGKAPRGDTTWPAVALAGIIALVIVSCTWAGVLLVGKIPM